MISPDQLRQFALFLPEAEEKPHFERTSFRVRNKIFATLSEDETEAVLKLTVEEQTALVAAEPETFFLVGWNSQGWIGWRILQESFNIGARHSNGCRQPYKAKNAIVLPGELLALANGAVLVKNTAAHFLKICYARIQVRSAGACYRKTAPWGAGCR